MNSTATNNENTVATEELPLIEQVVQATRKTERSEVENLLRTLTQEALNGTVVWNRNLSHTIDEAIVKIDLLISKQMSEILHNPAVQKLEGSWRGLHYLIKNTPAVNSIHFRVLNASKPVLAKNLEKASTFDQSELFKKIYEDEYGTPGGTPYGVLLTDYEITNTAQDINLLQNLATVGAAAFSPIITAASANLLGLDTWQDLSKPIDLEKLFSTVEYARYRGFRDTEDSRFITMVLPRTLARLPYGKNGSSVESFKYEELELDISGKAKKTRHENFTWMSSAYVLGARMTNAFAEYGWVTAIRGAEGGGKVTGLPTHTFVSDDGDVDMQSPTELGITDRREAELSKQGFLPLSHYKNTDYAVFFGAQTVQAPKQYDDPDATANAEISARLPYLMASNRIAHYLKVMARDKIGSFMEINDMEKWLNDWITNYVNSNPATGQSLKARFPLAAAKIQVKEVAGKPGSYQAIAWLRPWLQLEELSASLRLVARIPTMG